LILGERGSPELLRQPDKKCVIEGTFGVEGIVSVAFFTEHELEYEPETIIRREIAPGGKSRAFINDTPVNLQILKALTRQLVDIHRPYQTLDLADNAFQTQMLDALADQLEGVQVYRRDLKHYQNLLQQISVQEKQEKDYLKEKDFIQFQYKELEEANLVAGEQEKLENELKQLTHAGDIKHNLGLAQDILEDGELNVLAQLKEGNKLLQQTGRLMPVVDTLQQRLESVLKELQDIASETSRLGEEVLEDPERLALIQERLDIIYRLQKKHHLNNVGALITLRDRLQAELNGMEEKAGYLQQLVAEREKMEHALQAQCKKLTAGRQKAIPVFENKIQEMLPLVGMPHGRLEVQLKPETGFAANGKDKADFAFSANKGMALKPLGDVASVGEMSRIMLCIKSVVGAHIQLSAMVFDEIDTGISGQTAISVGQLLSALAKGRQIITITHLPQIAACGNRHYFVYKEETQDHTVTRVRQLEPSERVETIAHMLSGATLTPAALQHASELLKA
jgi:DNA repair protein RecN (Recombination protein N)